MVVKRPTVEAIVVAVISLLLLLAGLLLEIVVDVDNADVVVVLLRLFVLEGGCCWLFKFVVVLLVVVLELLLGFAKLFELSILSIRRFFLGSLEGKMNKINIFLLELYLKDNNLPNI